MMSQVAIGLIAAGGILLVAVCAVAMLRRPRQLIAPENDTVAFVLEGPLDGQLVHVEGRVVVERPVRAPSGRACAMVELYGSAGDGPARPVQRRIAPFVVDDGVQPVHIDPGLDLVTFDLPTAELDGGANGSVRIERRLEVGARVQVIGCIRRTGAPGHEELALVPETGSAGVVLTFLEV